MPAASGSSLSPPLPMRRRTVAKSTSIPASEIAWTQARAWASLLSTSVPSTSRSTPFSDCIPIALLVLARYWQRRSRKGEGRSSFVKRWPCSVIYHTKLTGNFNAGTRLLDVPHWNHVSANSWAMGSALRRLILAGIVRSVKRCGSRSAFTSAHRSGVETVAPATARSTYGGTAW